MFRSSSLLAVALTAGLTLAAPAGAQTPFTFQGASTGCFYGIFSSACTTYTSTAASGVTSFAGTSFGPTTGATPLTLSFGSFTLAPTTGLTASNFVLHLAFTLPGSTVTNQTALDLAGSLSGFANGATLQFASTPQTVAFTTATGTGSFQLTMNSLTFVGAGTKQLTGGITNEQFTPRAVAAVPEPSTVALLGAGVLGLAGVARRRRARTA